MNALVLINYIIFAVLASLFTLEVGAAIFSIVAFEKYKEKIGTYIAPVWEITGTFSVFFLVNLAVTYPSIVGDLGLLYSAPILLAAVFLVFRDAFLVYSEFFPGTKQQTRYAMIYGICTLITMFLITMVLGSVLSSSGVSLAPVSYNITQMLTSPFSLLLFGGLLVIAALCAFILYTAKNKLRFIVVPFLFVLFLSAAIVSGGNVFGGSLNLSSYLTPVVDQGYILLITAMGGAIITVALGFFLYLQHKYKGTAKIYE